ncbi:centromere protein I-like [Patiria miniata]|uniref:Centromere protein I n=1 Tax=Patiria miniata TaxID=46514 RepID=A0A913ZEQ8_PATMI|nr:centromere protein I-like [Patiria miniata]XP_038050274.1 centromere protein I-like [Patiria miniata]XP_038050275.1 centromere protein I-like [Patiria miniata]
MATPVVRRKSPSRQSSVGKTKPAEKSGSYSIKEAVRFFTSDSSNRKVRGNPALTLAIQEVEVTAKREGLSQKVIGQLVDVAASAKFPDSISSRLIKSLLPSDKIPQDAIVKAISWMCTNNPSNEIQSLLVRWVILTYDLLDDLDDLHALYGVLFHFIENDALCPHVCHLLYLLTRKEDVLAFRVQRLLSLQKRVGVQPYIIGLLSVYKMYRPHLVSLVTPPTQRVFFRQTDRLWSAEVHKAKERIQRRLDGPDSAMERLQSSVTDGRSRAKKKKLDVIPTVSTSLLSLDGSGDAGYQLTGAHHGRVPVQHIKSFDDLLKNMDRLELPSQIAAVLDSPYLQHALCCHTEQHVVQRLSFWLYQVLHQELLDYSSEGPNCRAEWLLQMLINFTDFLHEDVPVCENFLVKYLHTWNGSDYRPYILRLITRFRIYPFQKLNDLLLEPLRSLFFCSSVFFKCQVIYTLTELLRNYVSIELPRHADMVCFQAVKEASAIQAGDTVLPQNQLSVFDVHVDNFQALHTIQELTEYVDRISTLALLIEKDHVLLMHYVLEFFELVSCLHLRYGVPFVYVPSSGSFYRALFSSNAMVCSRLCKIICNYKDEFQALKKMVSIEDSDSLFTSNMRDGIQLLNQYILDLSNALWRNKAFLSGNKTKVFDIPVTALQTTGVKHINEAFSIHLHMAMLPFANSFLEQTQPEGKKVHPSLIRSSERDAYLEFLKRERLDGVVAFINTFIKRNQTTPHKSQAAS